MKISRTGAARAHVGENAVWDASAGVLFYADIVGQKVHRYDPERETAESFDLPGHVNAVALRQGGGLAVAMGGEVHGLDLASGRTERLAGLDLAAGAIVNDGKVDRRGRFLLGGCCTDLQDPRPIGGVYSLGADRTVTKLDGDISQSNGPCFSPDDRTFYFADSFKSAIYAYDYDLETGRLANRRLFADTRALGGDPDGATVDRDGLVWSAIFRGGKIAAFRPDGRLERVVELPVRLGVCVTFGGADLDRLFVTTIDPTYFGEAAEDGAGHVYVIDGLGARGVPEPRYAG